jgi:hypothetical protein
MISVFISHVLMAAGGVVRIPLNTFMKPASDLKLEGKELSYSDLSALFKSGEDLSTINPIENKYWQNKKYTASDSKLHASMPQSETGIYIDSYMGANRELGFYSVVVKTKDNQRYILTLGQQVHSSLLKSALLRKLGYYQEAPKYYSKIKILFPQVKEKETFINTAFCEKGPSEEATDCLSISPFKSPTNNKEYLSHAGEKGIYVHGVYLEKMNPEVPSLFDGLTPANGSLTTYLSTSRAFRALLVPFVVGDLGESINRVSTQSVFVRDGWTNINYAFSQYFDSSDASDVRWMIRRLGQLTDQDWNEIVDASMYPPAVKQLVKGKIIYRFKNFVDSFFDSRVRGSVFKVALPNLKYSSSDGYVVNGKVVVENIPGYPQRFSNGDRQSPFESGDFLRYLNVKAISSAIEVATTQLQSILKTQQNFTLDEKVKGIEVTPRGVRVIGQSTGTTIGIRYGASRMITTGTFFGSQAPIQLVDNVSSGANIGFMHSVNEVGGYGIQGGVQVSYSRDFSHVRPLNSIKESSRVSWADINVESKLAKLGKLLSTGQMSSQSKGNGTESKEKATDSFVTFMNELRSGEVFLITDSISSAAQAGVNVGLDSLVGLYAGPLSPTIGLSAGGAKIILRQIQIVKTDDGLQIFVRDQNTKAFSLAFDFNYFINLLQIKRDTLKTDLHTDAFILNYNAEFVAKGDKEEFDFSQNPDLEKKFKEQKEFGQKAASALRGLIFQSSTDQLYSYFNFQRFSIDHKLNTEMIKKKIFWYRATQMKEDHLLTIHKPEVVTPEGTTAVNEPIQIISSIRGELKGRDYLGFGLDVVDGASAHYLKGYAPKLSQATQNPTQVPFGKAEWRIVRTESEVSKNRYQSLPTVSVIQHVWGGWSINRKKLDLLLESVKESIKGTEYDGQELIPAHVLQNVTKLNFFKVTSQLSLMPSAIDKIRDLVIAPQIDIDDAAVAATQKKGFLKKLLSRISKNDAARMEDRLLYNNLLTLIGGGNLDKGRSIYLAECRLNQESNYQYNTFKGTNYECLEPWVEKIIKLSRQFNSGSALDKNKWMTEIIFTLEEKIPLSDLLKFLEKPNYIFFVDISGFRTGDENADQGSYISNILGEPEKKRPYSNGLITVIAEKSKIISTELNRTQADFQ